MMYERHYGYRYHEADDMRATGISKLIRRDVKQAISEGLLPARWKYSVRTRYASMMQAIDLEVQACPDAWKTCDRLPCPDAWCAFGGMHRDSPHAKTHDTLTEEADAAKMTLNRIHSAYNHDGSEIQTDYFDLRYYGHVEFESPSSAEWRARDAARKAARKAARAAQ